MPGMIEPDCDVALRELEELLCEIAAGRSPNRAESTRYSVCRAQLLASPLRAAMPGYLFQCASLLRFKDFITLFDPEVAQRQGYVRHAFGPGRAALGRTHRPEPDRRAEQSSHHWML